MKHFLGSCTGVTAEREFQQGSIPNYSLPRTIPKITKPPRTQASRSSPTLHSLSDTDAQNWGQHLAWCHVITYLVLFTPKITMYLHIGVQKVHKNLMLFEKASTEQNLSRILRLKCEELAYKSMWLWAVERYNGRPSESTFVTSLSVNLSKKSYC